MFETFLYHVCVPIHSMVKNIAIMDEVYAELVRHKRPDESFSHEIMRFIGKKGHILDLAGAWKMSEKEAREIKATIAKLRRMTTEHTLKKVGLK